MTMSTGPHATVYSCDYTVGAKRCQSMELLGTGDTQEAQQTVQDKGWATASGTWLGVALAAHLCPQHALLLNVSPGAYALAVRAYLQEPS